MTHSVLSHNKSIQKVTYVGMVVNIALAIIKILCGLSVGSIALLADGFHSFSDLSTDIAVLVGIQYHRTRTRAVRGVQEKVRAAGLSF